MEPIPNTLLDKIIPPESHKALYMLLSEVPELFKNTTSIGVFEGDGPCASFMRHSHHLNKITFYENFSTFSPSDDIKNSYIEKYKTWTNLIPNLEVKIEDGKNFDTDQNFIWMETPVLREMAEHIENSNIDRDITWSGSAGFGAHLPGTYELIKLIAIEKIFPIFRIRDTLYYAYSLKRREEIYSQVLPVLQDTFTEIHFSKGRHYYYILEYYESGNYITRANKLSRTV